MAVFSTIVETFTSPTINSSVWTTTGGAQTTVAHLGGFLEFNTSTSLGYATYETVSAHNLTGSYVCVEVVNAGNQSLASFEAIPIHLVQDASNSISFTISNGNIKAIKKISGTFTELASVSYNNSTMRFLRIREASGTTYWEYSSTRSKWTTLLSVANPIPVTALKHEFKVGTWANEASATKVKFDNFNYQTKIFYGTLTTATDPSAVWTSYWNAADPGTGTAGPNISTYAESSTVGSYNTNTLVLTSPNSVAYYTNTVTNVRVRMYAQARAAGNYVYADIEGGANSPTIYVYGNTPSYSSWETINAPTGGWNPTNLANLKATCYLNGSGTTNTGKVYGVQFEYTVITDKSSDFIDTFIGTVVDTNKWYREGSSGGVASQNNYMYLSQLGSSSSYAHFTAKKLYDLKDSSFYFQAKSTYSSPAFLNIGVEGRLQIGVSSTTVQLYANNTSVLSYTLPNTNPIYIKIREAAGVLYLDTSADNITYTNRGSITLSTYSIDFSINPMRIWFYVNTTGIM